MGKSAQAEPDDLSLGPLDFADTMIDDDEPHHPFLAMYSTSS